MKIVSIMDGEDWAIKICDALGIEHENVMRVIVDVVAGTPAKISIDLYDPDNKIGDILPNVRAAHIEITPYPVMPDEAASL